MQHITITVTPEQARSISSIALELDAWAKETGKPLPAPPTVLGVLEEFTGIALNLETGTFFAAGDLLEQQVALTAEGLARYDELRSKSS
jgi:hypothetical protein